MRFEDQFPMEELNDALSRIKSPSDVTVVEKGLVSLLNVIDNEAEESVRKDYIKCLVEGDIIRCLRRPLMETTSSSVQHIAAQLLAEIAKTDVGRDECVTGDVIVPLLDLLVGTSLPDSIQACRALGNICFDNDSGRHVINDNRGVDRLLDLLRDQLTCSHSLASKLRKVACGFLFNLINTHESVIEKSLSLGVIGILNDYIRTFKYDEDLIQMIILIVEILSDCEQGMTKITEANIALTIGQLLSCDISQELQEIVLDLFINLSENDDIKLQLVNSELFPYFLDIIKKPSNDLGQGQLEKLTSDLIILLLTGDRSMELLYAEGHGPIMSVALDWMKSSSPQLQISGALAIGNIARTDEHCIQLENKEMTVELLNLLDKHPVKGGNATLHHAILSALRNLAIPAANKPLMLGHGLISRILPYMCSDMRNVQFKLLGTLRMVIDHQESAAISLGTNESFLATLVNWCEVEDHEGVKGEANRLVSWLVKHSRSADVMRLMLGCGALPHIVNMLDAEHTVMQNEAIVALTLISAVILETVSQQLVDLGVLTKLKLIIDRDQVVHEITYNSLTLISSLLASDPLRQQAKQLKLSQSIKRFEQNEENRIETLAKMLISVLSL